MRNHPAKEAFKEYFYRVFVLIGFKNRFKFRYKVEAEVEVGSRSKSECKSSISHL